MIIVNSKLWFIQYLNFASEDPQASVARDIG